MVTAVGMSTRVPIVTAARVKPSYGAAVESHATTTAESRAATAVKTHAPATAKSPSSRTTTLGKGILWREAESDADSDCAKNS